MDKWAEREMGWRNLLMLNSEDFWEGGGGMESLGVDLREQEKQKFQGDLLSSRRRGNVRSTLSFGYFTSNHKRRNVPLFETLL